MIRFEHLAVEYDGVERLHDLSGTLPKGKFTALIGCNGCGKSTLMKCAANVLRPTRGMLWLDGQPYSRWDRRALARRIAYMPQSRRLPEMTVQQLVEQGRYPHRQWGRTGAKGDREIVRAAMRRTNVEDLAQRSLLALSGGERQRAYLAMMLAQQSEMLLLDEPTTYLDPGSQFALMQMLRELTAQGHAVVAVLHDLALALEYADHLLLMQDGRLIQSGTPEAVWQSGSLNAAFGIVVKRMEGRYVLSGKR